MSKGLFRRAAAPAPVPVVARSVAPRRPDAAAVACAPGAREAPASAAAPPSIRPGVPFAPGGATGLAARPAAQGLQARLGQPSIVENRPAAAFGEAPVAPPPLEGRTPAVSDAARHAMAPAVNGDQRHDAVLAPAHVGLVASIPAASAPDPGAGARGLADPAPPSRGLDVASLDPGSSNHPPAARSARAAVTGGSPRAASAPVRPARPAVPASHGRGLGLVGPFRFGPPAPAARDRLAGPGGQAGAPSPEERTAVVRPGAGRRGPPARFSGATVG